MQRNEDEIYSEDKKQLAKSRKSSALSKLQWFLIGVAVVLVIMIGVNFIQSGDRQNNTSQSAPVTTQPVVATKAVTTPTPTPKPTRAPTPTPGPTPTPSIGSGEYEQGVECMNYSEAQKHFPGISEDIIIPVDINDFDDYQVCIQTMTYKRYSWHVYNDGQKHNYGNTGDTDRYGMCCASYVDTDGTTNYLVELDGDYFWVRPSLLI